VKYIADLLISSNSTYLDVSGLPTGTYMVHFENERNKVVRPLVIAR
jgi:hypothetical protein